MPFKDKDKQRASWRKYYYANKEKVAVQRRRQIQKAHDFVDRYKKKGCEKCGIKHEAVIDFHHKDPSKKKGNISIWSKQGYGIDTLRKEIEKCNILCSNCHRILHWEERH